LTTVSLLTVTTYSDVSAGLNEKGDCIYSTPLDISDDDDVTMHPEVVVTGKLINEDGVPSGAILTSEDSSAEFAEVGMATRRLPAES